MRDLNDIKRDCELATDGPWLVCREAFVTYRGATADNDFICQGFDLFEDDFYNWDANARFIAHARQDVPDLVAEVERLHTANRLLLEERAAVRKALGEHFIAITDAQGQATSSAYYMDQGVEMLATQWQFSQDQLERAHQELAEAKAEVERLRAELTTTLVGCARCGQGVPPRYTVAGLCSTCAGDELADLRALKAEASNRALLDQQEMNIMATTIKNLHSVLDADRRGVEKLRDETERLREELRHLRERACEWRAVKDNWDGMHFESACDDAWMAGEDTPEDCGYIYCPTCGGKIVFVGGEDEEEEGDD